ncbi:glycosyltransferase family 2 protein [Microbacterium memoriense]|uniref:Glycosyltransferase family 2 protein n=1 Tax=Microbacterium memoriense TaxID=2978350 RepID=A0ABT2PBE8_9MICO|nr:glycosyltransferase family 2 protein [Microbacterium memoriense]MCT9001926.1 glycosyltransferase family 2 protein [Microbacterium memoriense]
MTDTSSSPLLSVIVVTYNSAEVVRTALSDLPLAEIELIVVDNGSADGTVALVSAEFPSAQVIQTGANLGFAKAVNKGVAASTAKHLLLLNPDAQISAETIHRAIQILSEDATIGILAPDVVEADGTLRTMAGGYEPTIIRMFTHASGMSRLAKRWRCLRGHYLLRGQIEGDAPIDVAWVSGGCLFSRKDTWTSLGGLSERWFMYAEDVEYCLRARGAGFRVVLAGNLSASHTVGASSGPTTAVKTVWLENLFDLYQSHYHAGVVRRAAWRAIVGSGYAIRSCVALLSPSHDRTESTRFAAYARAAFRARRN